VRIKRQHHTSVHLRAPPLVALLNRFTAVAFEGFVAGAVRFAPAHFASPNDEIIAIDHRQTQRVPI